MNKLRWLLLFLLFPAVNAFAIDPLDTSFMPTVDQTASHYSTAFGTITVTNSLYKVLRSSVTNATNAHWYVGYQMKNEFQSIQVHISPATNQPSVSVTMSNLVDTQTVPSSVIYATSPDITVYKEYYLNISTPSCLSTSTFNGGVRDYYPDPLIPAVDPYWGQTTDAFPVAILSTQTQSAWIDVHIPTGAPSGYYSGSIYVSSGGIVVSTLPVVVGVWNWLMPSTATLATAGANFNANGMRDVSYNGSDALVVGYPNTRGSAHSAYIQQWMDGTAQLLDNRWTAYGLDDYFPADVSSWNNFLFDYSPLMNGTPLHASSTHPIRTILPGAAMTMFKMNILNQAVSTSFNTAHFQDWVSTFTQQGWIDRLAYKLVDEPGASQWPSAISSGTLTRSFSTPIAPNLVTTNLATAQSFGGAYIIDWISPIISDVDTATSGDLRSTYDTYLALSSGTTRKVGSYIDCVQGGTCSNGTVGPATNRPYPNRMIDGTPVANRAMETWEYLDRMNFELYFAVDFCDNNPSVLCAGPSPWVSVYAFGNHGDGTLMYPSSGTVVTVSTAIWCPSMRLKYFRDGEQDYEYEYYLGNHGYSTFVSTQIATWMISGHNFSNNPAGVTAARFAMGNLIHQLSISSAPIIVSALTASGTVNTSFSYQIIASTTVTSYNASGFPTGLSINTASGLLSGTPSVTGVFTSSVSATNSVGTGTATVIITISLSPPSITSSLSASGNVGLSFSYQITASNSPTSYSASGLPSGLSVNTGTGVISGTPPAISVSNVTIGAANSTGAGPTSTLVITVIPARPPWNTRFR